MSLDDSTAPETAATSGGADRRSPNIWLMAGLALLLVVGLLGFFAMRSDSTTPEGADCVSEDVTITTAPVMESLV